MFTNINTINHTNRNICFIYNCKYNISCIIFIPVNKFNVKISSRCEKYLQSVSCKLKIIAFFFPASQQDTHEMLKLFRFEKDL